MTSLASLRTARRSEQDSRPDPRCQTKGFKARQYQEMLIFDRENWPRHRPWAFTATLVASAAIVWYGFYGFLGHQGQWHWPGGCSPPGFTFGILGGLIILFEMLLVPRKYLWRGRRLGRTKHWMTAHLWLGLIVLILLLLHGDFHFSPSRSTLAAVLMWLLVAVFVSGVWGAVVQTVLPRLLLERVPAETIYSQIDHVIDQYRDEAERLVKATCGPGDSARPGENGAENSPTQEYQLVGTMCRVGNVQGKVLRTKPRPSGYQIRSPCLFSTPGISTRT